MSSQKNSPEKNNNPPSKKELYVTFNEIVGNIKGLQKTARGNIENTISPDVVKTISPDIDKTAPVFQPENIPDDTPLDARIVDNSPYVPKKRNNPPKDNNSIPPKAPPLPSMNIQRQAPPPPPVDAIEQLDRGGIYGVSKKRTQETVNGDSSIEEDKKSGFLEKVGLFFRKLLGKKEED